jgi:hypothetical protein
MRGTGGFREGNAWLLERFDLPMSCPQLARNLVVDVLLWSLANPFGQNGRVMLSA